MVRSSGESWVTENAVDEQGEVVEVKCRSANVSFPLSDVAVLEVTLKESAPPAREEEEAVQ